VGLDALVRWLDAAGVPAGTVVVGDEPAGGEEGGVWRIRTVPPGEQEAEQDGGGWEVFWAEGGRRHAWTRFDDESTACFALFGRLTWVRLARGGLVRATR
jgi:hypothetical protein